MNSLHYKIALLVAINCLILLLRVYASVTTEYKRQVANYEHKIDDYKHKLDKSKDGDNLNINVPTICKKCDYLGVKEICRNCDYGFVVDNQTAHGIM